MCAWPSMVSLSGGLWALRASDGSAGEDRASKPAILAVFWPPRERRPLKAGCLPTRVAARRAGGRYRPSVLRWMRRLYRGSHRRIILTAENHGENNENGEESEA